jgi:hypothetical protein
MSRGSKGRLEVRVDIKVPGLVISGTEWLLDNKHVRWRNWVGFFC